MREDDFLVQKFHWFTAKVVDINDALKLNRVKVRCYGYHDKTLSKEDLPWATVIMPTTSPSLKGVGANHHLEVGSWVVGFFRDGLSAQDPMVMGSVATQEDGIKDIPTEAEANYPNNKVYKSNAGHLIEIDNTSGSERINVQHKSGTTINIATDGTVFINSSNTTVDITGNTTIHGNLTINGTTHSTGDVSTDAENGPTLATHTHIEVPGTGGSASPNPTQQQTSKPDETITP